MSIVELYGHEMLKERLRRALATSPTADTAAVHVGRGSLPASLLFQGLKGIGKQRLALWLAQAIMCEGGSPDIPRPCGACKPCRMISTAHHPDVYWIYPKARLKSPDPTHADVLQDYAESVAERVEQHGLYAPPSGSDGIYIATIRTIVQRSALAPAMSKNKVFIIGDAERMVSQEGADQAANAFLKLLEEPPADTTIILTSSEPGALLPTIRSRVISYRCPPLRERDVRAFLSDPVVEQALDERDVPSSIDERVLLAAGAPGNLFGAEALSVSLATARTMLQAAQQGGALRYETALAQGVANARGAFADALKGLNVVLRERADEALGRGDTREAYRASRGIDAVARAQSYAERNVNPQLVTARLLTEIL